jgi:hypothetical protein
MKRIGKYVAAERLILGNEPVTKYIFHGYENEKMETLGNQAVATKLTQFPLQRISIVTEELLGVVTYILSSPKL